VDFKFGTTLFVLTVALGVWRHCKLRLKYCNRSAIPFNDLEGSVTTAACRTIDRNGFFILNLSIDSNNRLWLSRAKIRNIRGRTPDI